MDIATVKTIWADDELKQNTHILIGKNTCVVIDAGCPPSEVYKVCSKPISAVFVTHGHYDHIKYIEEYDKLNVPIYASEYLKELLNSPTNNVSNIFSTPTTYKVNNLITLKDEQVLNILNSNIKCLYTPGHSIDGMCYIVNNKYLFSGDTLFSVAVGRIDLPTSNKENLIKSLNKLQQQNYQNLYTGHGRASSKDEQTKNIPMWISLLKMKNN